MRLHRSPDDRVPAHVIVKKDSAVEFVQVYTTVTFVSGGEQEIAIAVGENPWLEVRIDGRQGLVRDDEDLLALGLRQAG